VSTKQKESKKAQGKKKAQKREEKRAQKSKSTKHKGKKAQISAFSSLPHRKPSSKPKDAQQGEKQGS
jgi:hypothetical protein